MGRPRAGVIVGEFSGLGMMCRVECQPRPRCFLFVGEADTYLGGMQDYYGAYQDVRSAQCAIPHGVHWAEVATLGPAGLEILAIGRQVGGTWWWHELDRDGGGSEQAA